MKAFFDATRFSKFRSNRETVIYASIKLDVLNHLRLYLSIFYRGLINVNNECN